LKIDRNNLLELLQAADFQYPFVTEHESMRILRLAKAKALVSWGK
jgi:hypothetical protein